MPVSKQIAVADRSVPDKPPRIGANVRAAVLVMVETGVDFIKAAQVVGLKPDTLRRHLHRPEVVSLIKRERARFRQSVCCGNEYALAKIRDDPAGNTMAKVRAVQVLEGIEDAQVARPSNAPTPGVVIRVINVTQPSTDAGRVIDVTPTPKPETAIETDDPIFKLPGY